MKGFNFWLLKKGKKKELVSMMQRLIQQIKMIAADFTIRFRENL